MTTFGFPPPNLSVFHDSFMDRVDFLVFWLAPDGKLLYANVAGYDTLGFPQGKLQSSCFADLLFSISSQEWTALLRRVTQHRMARVCALLKCSDEILIEIELTLYGVHISGVNYICAIGNEIQGLPTAPDGRSPENRLGRNRSTIPGPPEAKLIGKSSAFQETLSHARLVARSLSAVLITGETGSGKEVIAKYVHEKSCRRHQKLVTVNCATLSHDTVISELFGHVSGAFTGANHYRKGLFEQADRGTLFLDEIGELPLIAQAQLLRVIESNMCLPLGGKKPVRADTRIIAATNRDLRQMVAAGHFRKDLFYRINVFDVSVPPLRERTEDIPNFVQFFLNQLNGRYEENLSLPKGDEIEALAKYSFPGNVRELKNLVERAFVYSLPGPRLCLREVLGNLALSSSKSRTAGELLTWEEQQRRHLLAALKITQGRVSGPGGAAERLAMNPKTLYSTLKRLKIKRGDWRL